MTTRAPADWSTTRRPATTTTRNEMRIPVFFFCVFCPLDKARVCTSLARDRTSLKFRPGKKKEEKIPETPSQKMTTRHGVEVGGTTRSADLFLIRSKRLWLCVKINSREKKKNWATSCRTLPARREKKCVFMFWPMPLWRQRRPPSVANSLAFFHERSSPPKKAVCHQLSSGIFNEVRPQMDHGSYRSLSLQETHHSDQSDLVRGTSRRRR